MRGSGTGRRRVAPSASAARALQLLELVRTGVEEFILNKATVKDFFSAIRAAGEKAKPYAHQLTPAVFSRIVRDAIRKRDEQRSS